MNNNIMSPVLLITLTAGLLGTACDGPSTRTLLADAIEDHLVCGDLARPSTLRRVRRAVSHPSLANVGAAVLAPDDLAGAVALAGPHLEGAVVAVRNVAAIVDVVVADDLLHAGWDGVHCGDSVAIQCTAGEGRSTVQCADDGTVTSIEERFRSCMVRGVRLDGAVRLTQGTSPEVLTVAFDRLDVDERRRVDGVIAIPRGNNGAGAGTARVVEPLTITSYGGVDGASCGTSLVFDTFTLSLAAEDNDGGGFGGGDESDDDKNHDKNDDDTEGEAVSRSRLDLDGFYASKDRLAGVVSGVDGVTLDGDCACPQPGSSISFEVPRPLSQRGTTFVAHVDWNASRDTDHCASVSVALEDWPADCAGLEDAGHDCGRGAVAATLQAALQAMCFAR